MKKLTSYSERTYLSVLVLLAWFALIFQFYLHLNSGAAPKSELIIRFFSYFTIDTNLLVALCSTSILCFNSSPLGRFFSKPQVVTAIVVYIIVVAIIYNAVLRFLWVLKGWSMILNELLHVIVPGMFLVYWIYFVAKRSLQWKNLWSWLMYPLIYTVFVLIRGSYADFYPYPFLNVSKFGLQQVMVNCAIITLLFVSLFLLFIGIGRRSAKSTST